MMMTMGGSGYSFVCGESESESEGLLEAYEWWFTSVASSSASEAPPVCSMSELFGQPFPQVAVSRPSLCVKTTTNAMPSSATFTLATTATATPPAFRFPDIGFHTLPSSLPASLPSSAATSATSAGFPPSPRMDYLGSPNTTTISPVDSVFSDDFDYSLAVKKEHLSTVLPWEPLTPQIALGLGLSLQVKQEPTPARPTPPCASPAAEPCSDDDDNMTHMRDAKSNSPRCSSPSASSTSSVSSSDDVYHEIQQVKCKRGTSRRGSRSSSQGGPPVFKCTFPDCSKSFNRSFNLRAHYSTHLGLKSFECSGCAKKFTRRFDVKRHQSSGSCVGMEILCIEAFTAVPQL